jgi:ubiquinone/menaquinone biosynthesis C-methylase UbiE
MIDIDISILQCPITKESLKPVSKEKVAEIIQKFDSSFLQFDNITEGFVNDSQTYFYAVFEDILLLLPIYALFIGQESNDKRNQMAFDKERVFKYYNKINYDIKNSLKIYADSSKWVDFREVSGDYMHNSFTKAKKYLNPAGKYILDVGSGPISLQEYIDLSENYEIRICADISVNALIQARYNYMHRKGFFICADITNIPLKENVCDAVLCHHTLYHIPKNEQKNAVNEIYRVAKHNTKIVIVYSLFYHSWFMNISLFPVQLYRIARHIAGKIYVRLLNSKPRLYFYPHSIRWFKRNFVFSNKIEFYCWRSTNKYFLNLFVHKWLGGKKLLAWLKKSEDKYPKFWGKIGEYPLIVIKK